MDTTPLGTLVLLALVDSTSFGTLGIPVVFLMQQQVRVATLLLYLCTIAAFYWLVGVALTLGADRAAGAFSGLGDDPRVLWTQLVAGVALFALSFLFDNKRAARRRAARAAAGAGPTRRQRWQAALLGPRPRTPVVMSVALGAGLVEVASMLPFLGAIGLMSRAQLSPVTTAALLAAYVVVMIVPALALLGGRLVAARAIEPLLARIGSWLERNSDEMLGWVVGIVGFLLAADAASRLALFG